MNGTKTANMRIWTLLFLGMSALSTLLTGGCDKDSEGGSDACANVDCSGHGTCSVVDGQAQCDCETGYHSDGLSCIEDTGDPCEGVDCSGHGTCSVVEGEAQCDCESGYHPDGLACIEDSADPCEGMDCSDHGTCSVVDGQAQCDCETGFHAEGLACVEHLGDACARQYLVEVSIPPYDENDPEHFLIQTNEDWSHINDPDKIHFYVMPNDYTDLDRIVLTQSGTESQPRTIALYNGNDEHPGALPRDTDHLAKVLFDINSSYWVIDRMALWDIYTASNYGIFAFNDGAEHNIINRAYTWSIQNAINIRSGAHNNTIQNSRFEDMGECDAVTIILGGMTRTSGIHIMNTKIINNEFYNQNDAIMPVRFINPDTGLRQPLDVEGLLCACNQMYIDDNTKPTTENGFDFKGGSMNPENPVIITGNIIWGYTGVGTRGETAVVGHYNVRNTIFTKNVIFDSAHCVGAGSGGPPNNEGEGNLRTGFAYSELTDNLFYNCGDDGHFPLKLSSYATIVEENTLID